MAPFVVVVEDEADILDLITYNLEKSGFRVAGFEEGESALRAIGTSPPDLIVLDLMLPGMDGLDVCRHLKQDGATREIPILMLTAKAEEVDRIVGLELGAEDYLTKPFSPRELVLRIQAILRRTRSGTEHSSGTDTRMRFGRLILDPEAHTASVDGRPVELTATEFKLLVTLAERRGRVQSREDLLNEVWGYEYGGYGRTVDTHIRRLREKLGPASEWVETVRGVGYRFKGERN